MGNIVWRFMKASPDTVGWAIGAFVSAAILQLAYVTRAGILRYHSIAEGSEVYDYVWFVYREMPSTLPMILVYSGAITAIMVSVSIFMRSGFTVGELPHAIRHYPLRFVFEVALPVLCLAGLFAGLEFGQPILVFLGVPILAGFLSQKLVSIWIDWVRTMVKSATEEEHEHAPGAEESSGGKHSH